MSNHNIKMNKRELIIIIIMRRIRMKGKKCRQAYV